MRCFQSHFPRLGQGVTMKTSHRPPFCISTNIHQRFTAVQRCCTRALFIIIQAVQKRKKETPDPRLIRCIKRNNAWNGPKKKGSKCVNTTKFNLVNNGTSCVQIPLMKHFPWRANMCSSSILWCWLQRGFYLEIFSSVKTSCCYNIGCGQVCIYRHIMEPCADILLPQWSVTA